MVITDPIGKHQIKPMHSFAATANGTTCERFIPVYYMMTASEDV
jgi:hypothetical protein